MNRSLFLQTALCLILLFLISACDRKVTAQESADSGTGPTRAAVVPAMDANNFKVDHPEQFPLATAGEHEAAPALNVTGVVNPDVSRNVPVISLASGRVVEIDARLGDRVKKGQLLFKLRSTDISGAFSDYRQAVANEKLTKTQLDRAQILFEHGAIPKSGLETAQNAEADAMVTVQTTDERLHVLGASPDHPDGTVSVFAPTSGVITDQQITMYSGVQALTAPNPFTISDLSHVWVICDVYENDLAQVHIGEFADIRLNAYPSRILKGRISEILPILDPSIRTAKVRIQVDNSGIISIGMFATATFHGKNKQLHAMVPATAILHLHDRDWVYSSLGNGHFRRQEVVAGDMLPGNMQEIVSGLMPGRQVVADALVLQNTVEQ
ncbi:MAG: efflux RND transporter periplasmic adaptor subunit [Bryobacteraceae bacterium]